MSHCCESIAGGQSERIDIASASFFVCYITLFVLFIENIFWAPKWNLKILACFLNFHYFFKELLVDSEDYLIFILLFHL